jgi:chaperonin cofactor prefoldin
VRNENEALRQDIQRLEENRIQTQGKTSETVRSLKQENEDLTKKIDSMFAQQEALNKKNQELQNE